MDLKKVRHASAALARSVWKTDVLAVTPMPRGDGWSADLQSAPEHLQSLAPGEVSRASETKRKWPDSRGGLQILAPVGEMAARAGIAPASSRLQRAAHLSELPGER